MEIFFSASAHRELITEFDSQYPKEAGAYPLGHLVLNEGVCKSPLDTLEIGDVARVVFTRVISPQQQFKVNNRAMTAYDDGAKGLVMNPEFVHKLLAPAITKSPLLDMFTLCHTHPFASEPWLSFGADHSDINTLTKKLGVHQGNGFDFVLEILGYGKARSDKWDLAAFAMTPAGLIELNKQIVVLSNNHEFVRAAKRKPLYRTIRGKRWHDNNSKELTRDGFSFQRRYLSRGWEAYTIDLIEDSKIVICVPPFPEMKIKAYNLVFIGESRNILELAVPDYLRKKLLKMNLVELVDVLKGECLGF
jgi:hypothetical protein